MLQDEFGGVLLGSPEEDEFGGLLISTDSPVAQPPPSVGLQPPSDIQLPQWEPSLGQKLGLEPEKSASTFAGFESELNERTGDFFREAARFVPSALKTAGVIANDPWRASVNMGRGILDFIAPGAMKFTGESGLTPPTTTPEQQPLYRAGVAIEQGLEEAFPPPQEPELLREVVGGAGQMASMLAGGAGVRALGAGVKGTAAAATALGAVQEFDDAFTRARRRGDDPDTALRKTLGYTTVASFLENRLGAGRILKQFFPSAVEAAKKLTAMGVSKKIIDNFITQGIEEGGQRFAQNWIVDETPSLEGVGREALVGGLSGGTVALPSAAVQPPMGIVQPEVTAQQPLAAAQPANVLRQAEEQFNQRTPDAIQQESTPIPGDVQQPEVAQESQVEVPAPLGSGEVAETRVEIPPLPTGDVAITVQKPDGTTYEAGFNGWQVSKMERGPDGEPVPTEYKPILSVLKEDAWSTGSPLPEGDKIVSGEIPPSPTPQAAPIGMGAATPSEFAPPKPFTTSNKNAVVDEERKERGLPPMMQLERESNQAAWDEAMRIADEQPGTQDALITELAANPRALTATENAMLMQRRIELRNEYEKALMRWREAFESDNYEQAAHESQLVKDWSNKLADLEDISKATGAESGRSLQARKMMAKEDFSLARMTVQAMQSKGRALTTEENMELIRAHEKIAELQAKLDAIEEKRESVEVEKTSTETMKEVAKEAPKEAKSKDFDIDREENLLSGIKAKVDKGQVNEITPLVQQLARLFWRRGVRTREPMIDALHETLQTIIPGFTREDTKRAFSGYGNFTPLSKEAIDVGLRDLKGQTQQTLKMEALEARKPLEKTGKERRVPTDEERRLIKQVNELKRKYGVVTTDPETQLKSALEARKTYYKHRIADLEHEIRTRERIVKSKTASPTDPELQRLIEEVERLKAEHETIFVKPGMSDEQKLKMAIAAAERNLAHWNVRLDNAEKGVFDKRQPGRKVTSPELEVIQAEAAAIREHVKELHDLDAAVVAQKKEAKLESQRAAVEKQIAEQERKLTTGDLDARTKAMNRPVADPELEQLLQKRDELNKALAEARKKPAAQKEAEARERELDRLHKSIEEKLDKIAAGDLSTKGKKASRPAPTPELEQARQALDAINKQISDMRKAAKPRKTKEEIALQSLKTRMANQIADLKKRIATKDFTKKERKPVALDTEATLTKVQLEKLKQEYQNKLEKDRFDRLSVFGKTKERAWGVYDLIKSLMATGEFSFVLRQGKGAFLEALVDPKRAVKFAQSFRDGLKAFKSPESQRLVEEQIFNDPMYQQAVRDKLYVPEHGTKLSKQEEFAMGRYADAVPGVSNFNRAAETFLKKLRFDTYKAMVKSLTKTGTATPEEGRDIAYFINAQTGRGSLGSLESSAIGLQRLFFSPRYVASRLQILTGQPFWKASGRAKKEIAKSYARMLIGGALYYTMLLAFFNRDKDDEEKATVETSPKSSDFGKIKIGNTRLDPMAGMIQNIVMGVRTVTKESKSLGANKPHKIVGEDKPYGKDDWMDYAARYTRSKMHPTLGKAINVQMEETMTGEKATIASEIFGEPGPMTWWDMYEALREQGIADGTALALMGFLGEGIQTYKKRN